MKYHVCHMLCSEATGLSQMGTGTTDIAPGSLPTDYKR
jgi:hypothetical protein